MSTIKFKRNEEQANYVPKNCKFNCRHYLRDVFDSFTCAPPATGDGPRIQYCTSKEAATQLPYLCCHYSERAEIDKASREVYEGLGKDWAQLVSKCFRDHIASKSERVDKDRDCGDCVNGTKEDAYARAIPTISCPFISNFGLGNLARSCSHYSERVERCGFKWQTIVCDLPKGHTGLHGHQPIDPAPDLCGAEFRGWVCNLIKGHSGKHTQVGDGLGASWSNPTPTAFDKAWEKHAKGFNDATTVLSGASHRISGLVMWNARGKADRLAIDDLPKQINGDGVICPISFTVADKSMLDAIGKLDTKD